MSKCTRAFTLGVPLVLAASCTTVTPSAPRRGEVIVQASDTTTPDILKSLRDKSGAELVAVLPRTKAEVWRFPEGASGVDSTLASLRADTRVRFTEALGRATTAYSTAAMTLDRFTEADRAVVRRLTAGVAAANYRIMAPRPASMNADMIDVTAQTELAVPLLSDVPVFTREAGQRLANGDFTWTGRAADGRGEASLVVRAQGITGRVQLNSEIYSILPLSDGRQLVKKETTAQFPPEHPPSRDAGAPPAVAPSVVGDAPPPASCTPADSDIDVFVTYSVEAKQQLPDPGGLAALAIVQANRSFHNSNIPLTLNLVGVQPSGYHETGDYDKDLAAMKSGAIPTLKTMRDSTAADVVVMLVANQQFCGMAGGILASADTAFAAVATNCAVANVSFAHELGHLFGARHDRPTDDENLPFAFGHGYALANEWRSVMAYPGTCNCTRGEFWADSAITRADSHNVQQPTGQKDVAEDARALRETAKRLAQFRCRSSRPTS
jgi:hypothetical protein